MTAATAPMFRSASSAEDTMSASAKAPLKGGEFLIKDESPAACFTPEDLTAEQHQIRQAVMEFMRGAVVPKIEAIENKQPGVLKDILQQAGALGFLAVEVPEEFGGLGLTMIDSALVFESVGAGGSGSVLVSVGAHNGIGTAPLLFFGNDAQRRKYLPKLASGEWIAAYALTEADAGSDALAAKTKAVLTDDGKHYKVNGTKRFITNAGFADLFTVFVKIDGKDSCLLVERTFPGVSVGKEEHKLGIKGSSTCELILEDALVPAENVLGEIGKGHRIVFNTLNIGRLKLGAGAVGAFKNGFGEVVAYAAERRQFGKALLDMDETRSKIADTVVWAWVGESMVSRTAGLLAKNLDGKHFGDQASAAIKEFNIECSLVKVALSEMVDQGIDHAVQLYGGAGYIEDYPIARAYRDSRINRIFEGTNEINRMLAIKEVAGRMIKGELDFAGAFPAAARFVRENAGSDGARTGIVDAAKEKLFFGAAAAAGAFRKVKTGKTGYAEAAKGVLADLRKPQAASDGGSILRQAVSAAKQASIFTLGTAMRERMQALENDQQILMQLADLLIWSYGLDSALLRLEKLRSPKLEREVVAAYVAMTLPKMAEAAGRVLVAVGHEADARAVLGALSKTYLRPEFDLVALRQRIGEAVAQVKKYPF